MNPTVTRALSTAPLLLLLACAHAPPEELVSARMAYQTASLGAAGSMVPAELHDAHVALEQAEEAWEERESDYVIRDLSYVAKRKAALAVALADAATADQAMVATAAAAERERALHLTQARADLATSGVALARSQDALDVAAGQLSTSEEARRDAAARAEAALVALAEARKEPRGLVITLSGSVLFRTGDATLADAGLSRLREIADALLAQPDRQLLVEGHTDSRGDDAYNLTLSQQRADAVRQVLVDRGYAAKLVLARGVGEARPVADNATAEGMANNRRVEIVVQTGDNFTGQR